MFHQPLLLFWISLFWQNTQCRLQPEKKTAPLPLFPDMHGKTVGIIGTGKIAKILIHILKGFGMNVLAYDLYPDYNFAGFAVETVPKSLRHSCGSELT